MAVVTKAADTELDGSVASGTDLGRWVNPANAFAETGDNTYATAVLGTGKNTGRASRFGFPTFTTGEIPDGSTVNSVTVTVEWGYTVQVVGCTLGVQLHNPGGTPVGTETTKTTATEEQSTQVVTTGITLTDLRTAGLVVANVRYQKGNNATDTTGNLDFVSLSVDWSEAGTPHTVTPADTLGLTDATAISEGHGVVIADTLGLTDVATPVHTPGGGEAPLPRAIVLIL